MAPESGEASVWPNRPGAASPAGWFLLADGEAAPPFRHSMEPARSDDTPEASSADDDDANGDAHEGAWYTDTDPQPTSLQPVSAISPWSFQNGSRHIPVVGPTEALRGRADGPGMAVPQGAVLDPHQRSGWQLAQQVWQDSGVVWEQAGTELHGAEFLGPDFAQTEPADLQPADMESARAWFDKDEPADPAPADSEFANSERADLEPADVESDDAWFDDDEPAEPGPTDSGPAAPEPAATESAGTWFDQDEPTKLGPVDSGPVDPQRAPAESAGTWFDGPGPADPRLAARRSVGERPTVVEFTGPYFADSGVIPMESQFPSPAIPRQPTFTPADNSRLPLRDRMQQESVRQDDVQAPRSAPARPSGRRPEPMGEDPELPDRLRFGSDQAGRARRPAPGWNEYPASGFPDQAWSVGRGQVPLGAPVMVGERAPTLRPGRIHGPGGIHRPGNAPAPGRGAADRRPR